RDDGLTIGQTDGRRNELPWKDDAIVPDGHSDRFDWKIEQRLRQRHDRVVREVDVPDAISARSIGQVDELTSVHNPSDIEGILFRPIHDKSARCPADDIQRPYLSADSEQGLYKGELERVGRKAGRVDRDIRVFVRRDNLFIVF